MTTWPYAPGMWLGHALYRAELRNESRIFKERVALKILEQRAKVGEDFYVGKKRITV